MQRHQQGQPPGGVDHAFALGPSRSNELERLLLVGGEKEVERRTLRDLPIEVAGRAVAHLGRNAAGRGPDVNHLGEHVAQARRGGDDRRLAGRRRAREHERHDPAGGEDRVASGSPRHHLAQGPSIGSGGGRFWHTLPVQRPVDVRTFRPPGGLPAWNRTVPRPSAAPAGGDRAGGRRSTAQEVPVSRDPRNRAAIPANARTRIARPDFPASPAARASDPGGSGGQCRTWRELPAIEPDETAKAIGDRVGEAWFGGTAGWSRSGCSHFRRAGPIAGTRR